MDLLQATGEIVLRNTKGLMTPMFGTTGVVDEHAVLVPGGIRAVVVMLIIVEGVSVEPVVVGLDRIIYGQVSASLVV